MLWVLSKNISVFGGKAGWQTYHWFESSHLPQQPVFIQCVQGFASYYIHRTFVYPLIESCHKFIEWFSNCLLRNKTKYTQAAGFSSISAFPSELEWDINNLKPVKLTSFWPTCSAALQLKILSVQVYLFFCKSPPTSCFSYSDTATWGPWHDSSEPGTGRQLVEKACAPWPDLARLWSIQRDRPNSPHPLLPPPVLQRGHL